MQTPIVEKDNDGVYFIKGELNMQTVPALTTTTNAMLLRDNGDVVIDLANVSRADSAGLALLVEWCRLARRYKLNLAFRNVPNQLMQIARLSELDDLLPLTN
jgi:phospholipid transport system transporter-binding protein